MLFLGYLLSTFLYKDPPKRRPVQEQYCPFIRLPELRKRALAKSNPTRIAFVDLLVGQVGTKKIHSLKEVDNVLLTFVSPGLLLSEGVRLEP